MQHRPNVALSGDPAGFAAIRRSRLLTALSLYDLLAPPQADAEPWHAGLTNPGNLCYALANLQVRHDMWE